MNPQLADNLLFHGAMVRVNLNDICRIFQMRIAPHVTPVLHLRIYQVRDFRLWVPSCVRRNSGQISAILNENMALANMLSN